jgi:hypothetical protein
MLDLVVWAEDEVPRIMATKKEATKIDQCFLAI